MPWENTRTCGTFPRIMSHKYHETTPVIYITFECNVNSLEKEQCYGFVDLRRHARIFTIHTRPVSKMMKLERYSFLIQKSVNHARYI